MIGDKVCKESEANPKQANVGDGINGSSQRPEKGTDPIPYQSTDCSGWSVVSDTE